MDVIFFTTNQKILIENGKNHYNTQYMRLICMYTYTCMMHACLNLYKIIIKHFTSCKELLAGAELVRPKSQNVLQYYYYYYYFFF
jgi:hypothetical protein